MSTRIALTVLLSLVGLSCATEQYSEGPTAATTAMLPVYTADGHVLGVERGPSDAPVNTVNVVVLPDGRTAVRLVLAPGWYLDGDKLRYSEHGRGDEQPRTATPAATVETAPTQTERSGSYAAKELP